MRNLCKLTLTLALVALMAAPALAQRQRQGGRGRGGFGGFGRGGNLLTNKSVQEELKLSSDQKTKAEELSKKTREMMQAKLRDVPRDQRREKMRAVMEEVRAQTNKALPKILSSQQLKRYKQIQTQQMGLRAFSDKEVQTALKLTDAQKTAIKEITEDTQKKMREELQGLGRGNFAKFREIREKLNKEATGKIASKLTTSQKKTWKELTGKPFQIKFERRPGGGRGGRGGRRDI